MTPSLDEEHDSGAIVTTETHQFIIFDFALVERGKLHCDRS